MNEMIVRVAKSLALQTWTNANREDPAFMARMFPGGADDYVEQRYHLFAESACTAIEAMREPTEAMSSDGYMSEHTLEAMGAEFPSATQSCANIYRAMIDAALKD